MAGNSERRDFIPYPTNRVVGTISAPQRARAAIEALLEAGFDREAIDILHGEEGVARLDPTGEAHGFLEQFQRTLIRTAAPNEEHKHLTRHVEDVRAGRFVIMVLAKHREQRHVAADILNDHEAEFVTFYGRWTLQEMPAQVQGAGRTDTVTTPEQIPTLFADAWNARDADAIAALFEDAAEFVNVTGLWWHDRASIRKAHAYGLARLFNESRLTIEETRVKPLRDDVAIVHARMKLSGQTAVGGIKRPRPRTSVFSFVVHRVGDRWLCASAHNTDVVPNMETHVLDEDGTFRSANYRTGNVSRDE